MGSEYESTIAMLMGIGNYSHAQVVRALRAAFNNADRAADYLINGIPQSVMQQQAQQGTGPTQGTGTGSQGTGTGTQGTGTGTQGTGTGTQGTGTGTQGTQTGTQGQGTGIQIPTGLTGTGRGNPLGVGTGGPSGDQGAAIRQMIQTNPQLLPYLLQQFANTNPQLVQALAQNPQAFQALMQSVASGGAFGPTGRGSGRGTTGSTTGTGTGTGTGTMPQVQRTTIPLTADEKKSIDNLENLGFGRNKAIEAYLLCDKNEELAANYLFDHAGDDSGGSVMQQDEEEPDQGASDE